jgi:hypothetical protein
LQGPKTIQCELEDCKGFFSRKKAPKSLYFVERSLKSPYLDNIFIEVGWSDPAPMTAPVPFGMN